MLPHIDKLRLYLVTEESVDIDNLLRIVEESLKGGTRIVQLREKQSSTKEFLQKALLLIDLVNRYNAFLIINDRIDIALAVGAHGVHIGQTDMPISTVRRLLPPNSIIGLSIEHIEQLKEANGYDLSYVALSPLFPTNTKKGFESHWGIAGLVQAKAVTKHPLIAIGGITLQNVDEVIGAGACGVAVVSAIFASPDPFKSTQSFLDKIRVKQSEQYL